MARILAPAPGMEVYDPTCGIGGLLVKCEIEWDRRMRGAGSVPLRHLIGSRAIRASMTALPLTQQPTRPLLDGNAAAESPLDSATVELLRETGHGVKTATAASTALPAPGKFVVVKSDHRATRMARTGRRREPGSAACRHPYPGSPQVPGALGGEADDVFPDEAEHLGSLRQLAGEGNVALH